ncbi:MAG TPA: twin-arginine translocation signal domain-containing protein [Pyrinomonadaceae bacterium]|jgi:hypothetical protein|nr:twin-arginine translocation signal domain-containing protein [Pyrinomonadaceae bacterium]
MKLSRRIFLKDSTVAGAGFGLAFYLPGLQVGADESKVFEPNTYIRITSDNCRYTLNYEARKR